MIHPGLNDLGPIVVPALAPLVGSIHGRLSNASGARLVDQQTVYLCPTDSNGDQLAYSRDARGIRPADAHAFGEAGEQTFEFEVPAESFTVRVLAGEIRSEGRLLATSDAQGFADIDLDKVPRGFEIRAAGWSVLSPRWLETLCLIEPERDALVWMIHD